MNAPPALVEAFLVRIRRLIEDARALPRKRVLVRPGYLEEDTVVRELHRSLSLDDDERWGSSANANPAMWPAGLPLPLTVAEALEVVERAAPAMAAELGAELHRLAVVLVAPAALDRVLDVHGAELVNGWPLPNDGPPLRSAAWCALEALAAAATSRRDVRKVLFYGFAAGFGDPWPPNAPPLDVARWAQPGLDHDDPLDLSGTWIAADVAREAADTERPPSRWPGGPSGAEYLAVHGLRDLTLRNADGSWRRYPGRGLALLYIAERAELPRVRATVAARLAFASARALAGVRDPGPLHFAALEAVLGEAGAGDLATAALADGATRARFAAELVSEARRVAEVVFTGDAPEGETEARALAGEVAERFAAVLDMIEPTRAGDVRAAAAERAEAVRELRELPGFLWIRWFNPDAPEAPPGWLEMLAEALWFGKWRPALEEQEQARRRVGFAVLLPRTFDPVVATTRAQRVGPVVGGVLTLEDARGSSLSELAINSHTAALPEYSPREIRALVSSMTSHRWIRFILPELQGLWFLAGREVPVILEGGKAGIVERLRAAGLGGSRRDEPVLPGVISAWGAVRAMTDRTVGNLYSYEMPRTEADWKTRTGRAGAVVKVSPGPVLDPHVMMAERHKLTIPLIRDLPPLHWVDPTSHSPVVTLSMLIVRDMWVQREEMLDEGGILGGAAWWSERTSEGGLTNPGPLAWDRVRDGLRSEDGRTEPGRAGGAPTPPFIRVVNPAEPEARWRYTLANDAARVWIENAGRASKGGAERFAKGEDKRKKGRLKP